MVPVVAKGLMNVSADTGATTGETDGVLCIPDLAINRLSVSRMCEKGYSGMFRKELCKVVSLTNEAVAIGKETSGLYKLLKGKGDTERMNTSEQQDRIEATEEDSSEPEYDDSNGGEAEDQQQQSIQQPVVLPPQ